MENIKIFCLLLINIQNNKSHVRLFSSCLIYLIGAMNETKVKGGNGISGGSFGIIENQYKN